MIVRAFIRKHARLLWLLAAVACLSVVLSPPQVDSIDALMRLRVARAIWQNQEVSIGYAPDPHHLTHLPGHDGRGYALYGIGQSLILVPLDVLAFAVAEVAPVSPEARPVIRDSGVALLYRLLQAPLLVLGCMLVLRRLGLSRRSATVWALAAALATPMFHWSYSMQEEALAGMLLFLALWLALSPALAQRPVRAGVLLGICFGSLLNVRYNGMLAAAGIGVLALYRLPAAGKLRLSAAVAGAMLPFTTLALLYNWARFGDVLQTGYQDRIDSTTQVWSWSFTEFVNLIGGPDYGLVWFSIPVLAGALLLFRKRFLRRPAGKALIFAFTVLLAGVVFLSGFMIRGVGGYGGPRYLGHLLILAAPFGVLALRALAMRRGRFVWGASAVLAVGAAVQLAGTFFPWQLETMQREVRVHAGLPAPAPRNVLLARFANLARLADGSLLEESLPAAIDRAGLPPPISEDAFRVATSPNYLPWRVRFGIRAGRVASPTLIVAATSVWCAALGCCVISLACFVRKLRPRGRVRIDG